MRRCIFIVIVAVVTLALIGIFGFRMNYYIEHKASPDVTVLYNNEEAFIFAGKEINGYVGRGATLLLSEISAMHSLVTDVSSDLIVIHCDEKGCSVFTINGFQHQGRPFVQNGHLYVVHTVDNGASLAVWRWNATTFERVDRDEAAGIIKSFTLFDDLLKKQGWKQVDFRFDRAATNLPLILGSKAYEFTLEHAGPAPKEEDDLIIQNGASKDKLSKVVRIEQEFRKVSKREYLSQFPAYREQ
jgi:hypothetical protein